MMAVTMTHSCHSSYRSLVYIFDTAPHCTKKTNQRVLACSGINIRMMHDSNGHLASDQSSAYLEQQFRRIRNRAFNPQRKVQTQTCIFSFATSEFDTKDLHKQVQQALQLVNGFVKQYFPNTQAVIAIQCDAAGGHLHAHVLFNPIRPNGKTIPTSRFNIFKLRRQMDDYLAKNYEYVTGHAWHNPNSRQRQDVNNLMTRSKWEQHIKAIINQVKDEVDNIHDFLNHLAKHGITVTDRKKNTAWTYHQKVKTKKGIQEYKIRDFYQRIDKKTGEVKSTRGLGRQFTKQYLKAFFLQQQKRQANSVLVTPLQHQESQVKTHERESSGDDELAKIKQLAAQARTVSRHQQRINRFTVRQLQAAEAKEQKQRHRQKAQSITRRKERQRRLEAISRQRRREQAAQRLQAARRKHSAEAEGPEL